MKFPNSFLFGVSSSAYQIEGAWNDDGKGESIWDRLLHSQPHLIKDGSNGDIACDSYHKFKQDIEIIKYIGFNVYKFSISWSRVLPNGSISDINIAGVNYYKQLINEIIENGIQPMVTLYHYDLPQKLQDIGGWCNPLLITYFEKYARLMFKYFGSQVKLWITFNEPSEIVHGYVAPRYAPYLSLECFDAGYIVAHNILKAHARAYKIYHNEFSLQQGSHVYKETVNLPFLLVIYYYFKGRIAITLCGFNFNPKSDSEEDKMAVYRARQFSMGWFAHPIYSSQGDYPPIMKRLINKTENKVLPQFTKEEVEEIKGSSDFFALNHYTTALAANCTPEVNSNMYHFRYANILVDYGKNWLSTAAHWCKVTPWGLKDMLIWIKEEYDNPPVYITENGCADEGKLEDIERINYVEAYLEELLKAITEFNCNVIGYNVWSLLDGFEWFNGFSLKYGIVSVNYDSSNRDRELKSSALFFQKLCKHRYIPVN